jgi:4-amino-4-deoxy-L-arabinose transferase-like glycosyltransferase
VLNSRFVDSVQAAPPNVAGTSLLARIAWTVLIVAALYVCYFSHLGAIGFVGPDEPRYAWIARDMAETGDYITPRLYGKPWFEKPPLYYWSAAISFKIFGVSEAAARLPSAIAALLATLALAWLGLRLYGAETARWLLLLLPTSVGMIGFSHAASTDMLFSATLTLALVAAAVLLHLVPRKSVVVAQHAAPDPRNSPQVETVIPSEEPPSSAARSRGTLATSFPANQHLNVAAPVAAIFFGLFLGLAILAKGPAALVLVSGAVFFWAIFTKRWRDGFRLFHPLAIAAFCLTSLPWYILCARRNPDFFRVFIIEHNFKRYLTPEFQHIQPFWYYAAVLLIALLPWTAILLWSAIAGTVRLWRTRNVSDATLLLLCWAAFCLLFFSISKSKLPGYILPAIPAIVLLTVHLFVAKLRDRGLPARLRFAAVGLTLVLLGIFAAYFGGKLPFVTDIRPAPDVTLFTGFMVLGGLVALLLALLRSRSASLLATSATILAWVLLCGQLWELDLGVSARPMVKIAVDHLTVQQLAGATTYQLRRDFKYQVDFYLQRETAEWSPENSRQSIIFTQRRYAEELVRLGVRCPHYIAFPAVWICEDTKGDKPLLVHGAADGGKPE